MTTDVLDKIDETLTYYSAGLGEEVRVPLERDVPVSTATAGTYRLTVTADQLARAIQRSVEALRPLVARYCGQQGRQAKRIARRERRAQLRRVRREYVQRNRRRPLIDEADWHRCICCTEETP